MAVISLGGPGLELSGFGLFLPNSEEIINEDSGTEYRRHRAVIMPPE